MWFVFTFTITRFLMLILATDLILMENYLFPEIRLALISEALNQNGACTINLTVS